MIISRLRKRGFSAVDTDLSEQEAMALATLYPEEIFFIGYDRVVIIKEGEPVFDGRVLDPMAMYWVQTTFPIVWNFGYDDVKNIQGRAYNPRREPDGSIVLDVPWHLIDEQFGWNFEGNKVRQYLDKSDEENPVGHVTSICLRGISRFPIPANPTIKKESTNAGND